MKTSNTTINRKLRKSLVYVFLLAGIFMGNAQFSDPNFYNALLNHDPVIDTNGDGEINFTEASSFAGTLNVSNKDISDLTGIEYFVNITGLDCRTNNLTGNLDLSSNIDLEFAYCSNNNLTGIDVSGSPNLKTIWASNNNLTSIDVSANTALESLSVQNNNLTGELNLSGLNSLMYLECFGNQLTKVKANILSLTLLKAYDNPNLTEIQCHDNQITELNLSGLPALETLNCYSNNLTSLDVSNNPALVYLDFYDNNVTSIDVSNNPALEVLGCGENGLTSLDVSNNPALEKLFARPNNLTSLNLANGNNPGLATMYASQNDLTCIQIDSGFTPPTDDTWQKDPEAEYSDDCAMSVNDIQTQTVAVYPNPAQDKVFFDSAEAIQKITFYDLSGSKVKEFNPKSTNAEVSISGLSAGIYLAEIQTAKGKQTVKVVKK